MPRPTIHCLILLALTWPALAGAFTVNISSGSRALYLRVGDGEFSALPYNLGGAPRSGGARNVVTADVPAAQVGNGSAQAMSGTARLTSDWDRFAFCNSGQIYIGGFFRSNNNNAGSATLTASVAVPLTNGTHTIAFSQIHWTATGNSDPAGAVQPIPANNFDDTSKVLAAFPVNTWRESCHSFRYANTQIVPAGTYQGTIIYTLATP